MKFLIRLRAVSLFPSVKAVSTFSNVEFKTFIVFELVFKAFTSARGSGIDVIVEEQMGTSKRPVCLKS
ncbi:hypothetical protein MYX75_04965 [Acidobacteria bacterium AH-259-A15]|nr:hypothetical protein [Acidobacteria bacterium AH-259-A15]